MPRSRSQIRISDRGLVRRDRGQVAQGGQTRQGLSLELPDALSREVELMADRLERPRLALKTEAKLENPPLAFGQRVQRPPDALLAQRLLGLLEGIRGLAVGEEIAKLALVVRADRLVQRDRRVCGAERLVDVLHREARGLRQLVLARLATELDLESARRARQLLLPLDDVDRYPDRSSMVRDRALDRLADPPRCVGRELEPPAPVELLDRAVETERSLLDQIEEGDAEPAIALRDRDDQP